jgi:hypothetical protein
MSRMQFPGPPSAPKPGNTLNSSETLTQQLEDLNQVLSERDLLLYEQENM